MSDQVSIDLVADIIWSIYWIGSLVFCFFSFFQTAKRMNPDRDRHFWSILVLQLMIFVNLFLNYVAELNWTASVLNDTLRIGGMISTALFIWLFPAATDTRKEIALHHGVARIFKFIGIIFSIHYLASSIYFFSFRYDGSFQYFGGYRYIPAYSVFIIQGLAIAYSSLAILKAKSSIEIIAQQLAILKRMVYRGWILFPLVFVVDLVRYFFPILWQIIPEEKLLFTPLSYILLNFYFSKYVKLTFTEEELSDRLFPQLSNRENEVANLLCDGLSYREIGETLFISMATVRTHVTRIYQKTGVTKKEDLIIRYSSAKER